VSKDENSQRFRSVDEIPDDIPLSVDKPWRDACRARLKEMGRTQKELADHVGCNQSGVSQLIGKEATQRQSSYTRRISWALQVAMPPAALAEMAIAYLNERDRGMLLLVASLLEYYVRATHLSPPENQQN